MCQAINLSSCLRVCVPTHLSNHLQYPPTHPAAYPPGHAGRVLRLRLAGESPPDDTSPGPSPCPQPWVLAPARALPRCGPSRRSDAPMHGMCMACAWYMHEAREPCVRRTPTRATCGQTSSSARTSCVPSPAPSTRRCMHVQCMHACARPPPDVYREGHGAVPLCRATGPCSGIGACTGTMGHFTGCYPPAHFTFAAPKCLLTLQLFPPPGPGLRAQPQPPAPSPAPTPTPGNCRPCRSGSCAGASRASSHPAPSRRPGRLTASGVQGV